MSAKKITTKRITMGMYKGRACSITKKKASEGNVIVNIVDGPTIEIHKDFVR